MKELFLIKNVIIFYFAYLIFIFFIALLVCIGISSLDDNQNGQINLNSINDFSVPFKDGVNYVITSLYGTRSDPISGDKKFHSGIDVAANPNTEIVSSANGKVIEVGYSKTLGYYAYIEHYIADKRYITAYGHMKEDSIVVYEGHYIKAKEKIGIIGSTGKSTGIHCHFMIMKDIVSFKEKDLIDPKFVFDNDKLNKNVH